MIVNPMSGMPWETCCGCPIPPVGEDIAIKHPCSCLSKPVWDTYAPGSQPKNIFHPIIVNPMSGMPWGTCFSSPVPPLGEDLAILGK